MSNHEGLERSTILSMTNKIKNKGKIDFIFFGWYDIIYISPEGEGGCYSRPWLLPFRLVNSMSLATIWSINQTVVRAFIISSNPFTSFLIIFYHV